MRKVNDGKRKRKKEKKIMSFLVATNVVASRPPERQRVERQTLVPKEAIFGDMETIANSVENIVLLLGREFKWV